MQARTLWSPPTGPLGRLTTLARVRAEALGRAGEWKAKAKDAGPVTSFQGALAVGPVAVIAEVKRKSPSKGALHVSMDASHRARDYEAGGAKALSVLTEPSEFGGAVEDLVSISKAVSCPLLKKDFHVDPIQMFEARACGASAALLIVRALGPDGTRIMADAARQAGVEALFEIRDEQELSIAIGSGATLIGVNRRNLETLVMEPVVITQLLPMIPRGSVAIAESGISTRADIEEVAALGADAVLVGSSLSVAENPVDAVARMVGIPRRSRA